LIVIIAASYFVFHKFIFIPWRVFLDPNFAYSGDKAYAFEVTSGAVERLGRDFYMLSIVGGRAADGDHAGNPLLQSRPSSS